MFGSEAPKVRKKGERKAEGRVQKVRKKEKGTSQLNLGE
jgi:hypothetical protein